MSAPLTFLFTDLESSTELWEQYPDAMHPALARHDALLKSTTEGLAGRVVKTTGDGLRGLRRRGRGRCRRAGRSATVTEGQVPTGFVPLSRVRSTARTVNDVLGL